MVGHEVLGATETLTASIPFVQRKSLADLFDFGDRFSMDDGAEVGELKELNIKTTA